MNVIYGNFSMKMEVIEDDEKSKLARQAVEDRLKAAENILRATCGIEMEFQWEKINLI